MSIATAQSAPSLRHLVGKLVVVVGGSSGIGYSVAKGSLEHGAKVIISSSSQAKVDAAVAKLLKSNPAFQGSVSGLTIDAKDVKSIEAFWDKVGKFDHLAWTAGDALHGNFLEDDLETQKSSFDVRFWGPVLSAKYAYKKGLINPGASITMTGGANTSRPSKGWAVIAGAGGAIEAVTRGLAVDLAPIRVNTISPGAVETELWDGIPPEAREGLRKHSAQHSLVGRAGHPDELAEAYLFLMECSFVTGQVLSIEGGRLLA